jgi:hypothetical protein
VIIRVTDAVLQVRGKACSAAFADQIDLMSGIVADLDQLVTGFLTEVRDIHDRRRIIGVDLKNAANCQWFQPLARLKDGQGAQQANGV